jgi:DNA-directed RNA polymerase specialized sigma54-like protein
MKARLQTSLGQHLVMTPQLRQAIKLLQMSSAELEVEIAEAVESNPLLEWAEDAAPTLDVAGAGSAEGEAEVAPGPMPSRPGAAAAAAPSTTTTTWAAPPSASPNPTR